ncbi:hypothetical protein PAE9249_01746 [Paenibacillus sp. CECT 9249]|uniref:hypothetical protein n=1 Tax=Paenibacillus sp. CECT 9249 TaxID=2845385 RepID=UPI001E2C57CF|nr:hypothetical protein [Paenibacillus sp. CECT 9249]CAH0119247.1 hypothetical protein PAE9249_01746 [Paenibacillus sp. CECT 9249]
MSDQILNQILEELGGIKTELGGVKEDIKGLKAELGSVKEDIAGIKAELGGVKTDIKGLKAELEEVKAEQRKTNERLDRLETKVDRQEVTINAIFEQTANLIEFRSEATSKLETIIEDQKSIHEILGEHEVSIRTLRRKPV